MSQEASSPNIDSAERGGSSLPRAFDEHAHRAARSTCTILITGETGVGKGYMATWLHRRSARDGRPFIPVNCGAIPETIIDSQLFGHVRGAFSGATSDHLGLVRAAEGGTLFLDEVGELPPSAQTRLLRLLQDHEVQPVGRSRPVIVDVRIIAATNGELREAVRKGTFREDLLFRLDVIRLHVKPLRERPDELVELLDEFNGEFAQLYEQDRLHFDGKAMQLLRSCPWPGNIRQLRTVVERLHVLCPNEPVSAARLVEIGHRGDAPTASYVGPERDLTRSSRYGMPVGYEELLEVLDENGGSVVRAATAFGVHRSTIYRWLQGQPRS